jgi:hypothetical protein
MSGISFGRYYALVLGAQHYQGVNALDTPAADASRIAQVLQGEYGFEVTKIIDPTKPQIVNALAAYAHTLGPDDNLLIYYAGHGIYDPKQKQGYWVPIGPLDSARVEKTFISNKALNEAIRLLKAGHVMVVADACFSGSLVQKEEEARQAHADLRRWVALRGRTALTSGQLEVVNDNDGQGHSPFASTLVDMLVHNQGMVTGNQLGALVTEAVRQETSREADRYEKTQTPGYGPIIAAGHEAGGDFFFVRSSPAGPAPAPGA